MFILIVKQKFRKYQKNTNSVELTQELLAQNNWAQEQKNNLFEEQVIDCQTTVQIEQKIRLSIKAVAKVKFKGSEPFTFSTTLGLV